MAINKKTERVATMIRLPPDVLAWADQQASQLMLSRNQYLTRVLISMQRMSVQVDKGDDLFAALSNTVERNVELVLQHQQRVSKKAAVLKAAAIAEAGRDRLPRRQPAKQKKKK